MGFGQCVCQPSPAPLYIQSIVAPPAISIHNTVRNHSIPDYWQQCISFCIRNNLCINLATSLDQLQLDVDQYVDQWIGKYNEHQTSQWKTSLR